MECKIMLRFSATGDRRGMGFGRGIVQLLEGVDRTGSLYAVAREMGMAYSKAWRLVKDTEAEFGVTLLFRDGARGSRLTDTAREMTSMYHETLTAAQAAADTVFGSYPVRNLP